MTKIWDLFTGFDKAYGQYDDAGKTDANGKAKGRPWTVTGPVTPELWQQHLTGKGHGLGVIPLLSDNTVWWACLDVDIYKLDHNELIKKIELLGLPLVVCRSKSGGAHLFVFFSEPVPAAEVRPILEEWSSLLGHGGCEIFPKQVSRYDDKDIGNWLNMPYFNAAGTTRYGMNGKVLTLDEFVEYASSKRTTLEAVKKLSVVEDKGGPFAEGPPCLQTLLALGGFKQGTKKDGMFNVGIYARKLDPDDWQKLMAEYNRLMCNPPLMEKEVAGLIKSIEKKNYSYRCKLAPINEHCRRTTCLTRRFGVGASMEEGAAPEIDSITKYDGNPPLWIVDVAGRRVELTTEELTNQKAMRVKIFAAINVLQPLMQRARYETWLNEKMKTCEVLEVPKDASETGRFELIVNLYLTGLAQAKTKDELAHRFSPYWTGQGEVWFRLEGLLEYLKTHNFSYKTLPQVYKMLRDMGATNKNVKLEKGHSYAVWILPDPGDGPPEPPTPEFGTKEF